MTKPDDIPQDVWEAAENAVYRFCNKHHLWGDLGFDRAVDLHETIARAIMAAKAEEREAVKHWLTCEAEINDELEIQIMDPDGKGWHQHFAEVQRRNAAAINAGRHVEKYAAAIRKRGEAD